MFAAEHGSASVTPLTALTSRKWPACWSQAVRWLVQGVHRECLSSELWTFWLLAGWQANWWDDSQDKLDLFHRWVKLEWHIFWTDSYPAAWMRGWIWPVGCRWPQPSSQSRYMSEDGISSVGIKHSAHGWTKYFILGLFLDFLLENMKKKKKECFPVSYHCAFLSIKH